MSRRSVTTLARKLRAAERAYVATLQRDLREHTRWVESAVRASRGEKTALLAEGLVGAVTIGFGQGAFLLQEFTAEMLVAVGRDVRAVSANMGVDLVDVVAGWEPYGWEAGAMSAWEEFCERVAARSIVEVSHQAVYAREYDDDPEEGFYARMFSADPLRMKKRPGRGLFPAVANTLAGGVVGPAYEMVNAQRIDLFYGVAQVANA